jgi:protein tyrosine phosphatase (PTP) superfamily phosphohydrolase (DUF442 family)
MRRVIPPVTVCCLCIIHAGCSPSSTDAPNARFVKGWSPQRVERSHLPNAYRLNERVISGGQPDGGDGYRELSQLGVKTVISVDGAQPQVELARKHGLRYVHLPHGYDGIPERRACELAKAVRDLPGPIYVHCHHGKHRSPAAATVACVGAGLLQKDQGLSVLRTAGTSEKYQGLYESAKRARRFDNALLDALSVEFPETVEVPPMAEAMVAIEHTHDHLVAIQQAGWESPVNHPDLDPPHEALLLREHFTELLRTEEALEQSPEFQKMLRDSEAAAAQLEAGLRSWSDHGEPAPTVIDDSFARITNDCKACHSRFRDVPLSEKRQFQR